MNTHLTPFDIVPGIEAQFHYPILVEKIPSERLSKNVHRVYVKVNVRDLAFLLNALKTSLGKDKFNEGVGLRRWDIGLVMIDANPLSDEELIKALVKLKEDLTRLGILPDEPFHEHQVSTCIHDLCQLHHRLRNFSYSAVPTWDMISEDMEIAK